MNLFRRWGLAGLSLVVQFWSQQAMTAQLVLPEEIPPNGTFWSLQRSNSPPLPFFAPYLRDAESPVYLLDAERNVFLVDDSTFDYAALYQKREEQRQLRRTAWELGLISDAEYCAEEGGSPGPMAAGYGPEDLWLEITGVTNNYAYLTLHGTSDAYWYQLLSKTNLAQAGEWTISEPLSEPRRGDAGTNLTIFPPENVAGISNMFFRAHQVGKVYIVRWDSSIASFVAIRIPYYRRDGYRGLFEHVTFAPIDLPPLAP